MLVKLNFFKNNNSGSSSNNKKHANTTKENAQRKQCKLFFTRKIDEKKNWLRSYDSRKEREIGEALMTWQFKKNKKKRWRKQLRRWKARRISKILPANKTTKQKKSKGNLKRKIIHSERTWKSHNWRTIFGTIWRLSGWSSKTAQGVYSKGS